MQNCPDKKFFSGLYYVTSGFIVSRGVKTVDFVKLSCKIFVLASLY